MKKIILLLTAFPIAIGSLLPTAYAQDSLNMTKLGHLPYSAQLSNIWGYETEGYEYALVGTDNGMSIVDVTDPANPTEVFFKPGPGSIWREMKVFNDHVYITTEAGGGLQIVDMTPLPQNTNLSSVNFTGTTHHFTTAHTLYIDENGILYIFGSDYGEGGALIYDLNNDPSSPVELGVFDDYYIHDGMVRGDTLWASCIYDGFLSVIDVSDKANPNEVTTFNTPNNFTHNSWPNNNNHYLFTTDEVSSAYVASYDVSDFSNITELDRFQHHPGTGVIPHNAHFLNNYVFTSYYTDGVVVIDATNPDNLVEAGYYDTSPNFSGNGFNGCWGVYPYLPSGNIIASDMNSGLWILSFNNTQACFLAGTVTDISNGNLLNGVTVEILATTGITTTNIIGEYSTGFANANTYSVQFSKGGYITQTINNVVLISGNNTTLDVQLTPDIPFNFTGQVVEEGTGNAIPNAFVKMYNNQFSYDLTADANGFFNVPQFFAGNYQIVAGKWEYITWCGNPLTITSTSGTTVVELAKGYYDDFSFNFGWTETNTSPTGQWERGVPVETEYNGDISNPGVDVNNDCLDRAYVTGNGGGSPGDDDVDDGNVALTSPVFDLSGYIQPYIIYSRWFFNGGGNGGSPNDSLIIEIGNGQETVAVKRISAANTAMSVYVTDTFQVASYLTPTNTMTLKITATDYSPGHLVEAGLDKFYVVEGSPQSLQEEAIKAVEIYPNPAGSFITVAVGSGSWQIKIYNAMGQQVFQSSINNQQSTIDISSFATGIYFLKIIDSKGETTDVEKLIKN